MPILVSFAGHASAGELAPVPDDAIVIKDPARLPARIPCRRTPLGVPDDYKPWVVQCRNGELLIVAFCYGGVPYAERAVFWRSGDAGKTWGPREERRDIHGREFSLNCLSDGTLIMPCYLLQQDAHNKAGYLYCMLYRSTDNGKSWSVSRIGPEGYPARAEMAPERTVTEMPDPDDPNKTMAMLGVGQQQADTNISKESSALIHNIDGKEIFINFGRADFTDGLSHGGFLRYAYYHRVHNAAG